MSLFRCLKRNFICVGYFKTPGQVVMFLSITAIILLINEIFLQQTSQYFVNKRGIYQQHKGLASIVRAMHIAEMNEPQMLNDITDHVNDDPHLASEFQRWKYPDKRYYPIHGPNDTDFYFYSAFLDDRIQPAMIRLIGLKGLNFNYTVYCRFPQENANGHIQTAVRSAQPIFDTWPCRRKNCRHTAYLYSCVYPQFLSNEAASTVTVFINPSVSSVTLPILNGDGLDGKRKGMGLCLKSVTGNINATRMVEWIEMNKLVGVEKVIVYNTNVTSNAIDVLEDYAERGTVELIPDLFPEKVKADTNSFSDGNTHRLDFYWLQQQAYLVAYNDCLYRFRKNFKYLLVVDYDEVIVPNKPSSLTNLVDKLFSVYPNTSAFAFKSAQHLTYFGAEDNGAPSYLHMMHYLRRTKVVFSQPKSVLDPSKSLMINWHTVVTNIEPYKSHATNILVAEHYKHAFVHHYRYRCRSNDRKKCQNKRKGQTVDDVMPRYLTQLDTRVKKALKRLGMVATS